MRLGRVEIDLDEGTVTRRHGRREETFALGSSTGFSIVSDAWVRTAWNCRYTYGFTWLGRPVIQIPEDLVRLQELVYRVKPDVIIETGVAHGGGQIFLASLCHAIGRGKVFGIDVEIKPRNRRAILSHEMAGYITLIDGSSTDAEVLRKVRSLVKADDSVLVILDSNHTRDHVRSELESYAPLIRPGGYIVATDGIMENLAGAPGSSLDWAWNNPKRAVEEFLGAHAEFQLEVPPPVFNEGLELPPVTHWPSAYLRRVA